MNQTKIISDVEFGNMLREKPLYSKFLVTESFVPGPNTFTYPTNFDNKVIRFYCKNDGEIQTFQCSHYSNVKQLKLAPPPIDAMLSRELPPFWDEKTKTLDLTLPVIGECTFCKNKIYFLLNIFSNGPYDASKALYPNIFIQKVGQLPAFEIRPEKEVLNYLVKEDRDNYSKALANLSIGYGIGAFAYFRRIIENEIKRITEDIVSLASENSKALEAAYLEYEQDHQMNKLITSLSSFMPSSLKGMGDNPIKLLYDQLSGGIHLLSDEECMKRATSVDLVLRFTIKKLNEEKREMQAIKQAMQDLRNSDLPR